MSLLGQVATHSGIVVVAGYGHSRHGGASIAKSFRATENFLVDVDTGRKYRKRDGLPVDSRKRWAKPGERLDLSTVEPIK